MKIKKRELAVFCTVICIAVLFTVILCAFQKEEIPSTDKLSINADLEVKDYRIDCDKIKLKVTNNSQNVHYDVFAKEIEGFSNGEWKKIIKMKAPYDSKEFFGNGTFTFVPEVEWEEEGFYRVFNEFAHIDDLARNDYNKIIHWTDEFFEDWPEDCRNLSDFDVIKITYIVGETDENDDFSKIEYEIKLN